MPIPVNIPWKLIGGAVGILAAIAALWWLVSSRDSWRDHAKAADAALVTTVTNYRTAAEQARKADADNKARVEAEQRAVNERTAHEYETRITDARAHYERLRAQSGTAPRRAGTAPMSVVPEGTTGTPGPAQDDGFSLADRLTATEQAIQLDQLIRWVKDQTTVNEHPTR